jgi:lipase
MSYQKFQIPVEGGELTVGVWGDRDAQMTILAPHGITANHTCWQPLSEALPDARIIAPDLRGRGASNNLGKPFGLLQHAKDMLATLDYFDVAKAMVVGHSMGAFVSVRFAANFPDRVTALLLVDGGLPLKKPSGVETDDLVAATLGPAAERLARVFGSRSEYQEFWKEHPAFSADFNKYVSAYVDYDLIEVEQGFKPSGRIESVEADIRELFGEDQYLQEMQLIRQPVTFMRAPRGLLDDDPLYSDDLTEHHSGLIENLSVQNLQDFNHYTIVLSKLGSQLVADQVNEIYSKLVSQETR